jgi:Protein of unknown function (DUF664)
VPLSTFLRTLCAPESVAIACDLRRCGFIRLLPRCASPMMAAMATTRRADMFTADGKPSDDDPREHGPRLGDGRATLAEALRRRRLTLEIKCAGLDAEAMARRSVELSTMSLLGLVRHLADMERMTFREMMAGQDAAPAVLFRDRPRRRFQRRRSRPAGGRGSLGCVACGGGLRHPVRSRGRQSGRDRR